MDLTLPGSTRLVPVQRQHPEILHAKVVAVPDQVDPHEDREWIAEIGDLFAVIRPGTYEVQPRLVIIPTPNARAKTAKGSKRYFPGRDSMTA
jgi:hypothetical protein